LFYVLEYANACTTTASPFSRRAEADAFCRRSAEGWNSVERALVNPPTFVDRGSGHPAHAVEPAAEEMHPDTTDCRAASHDILSRMVKAAGFWRIKSLRPFAAAEARPRPLNGVDPHGKLRARVNVVPKADLVLPLQPLWYIDTDSGQAGTLLFDAACTDPPADHAAAIRARRAAGRRHAARRRAEFAAPVRRNRRRLRVIDEPPMAAPARHPGRLRLLLPQLRLPLWRRHFDYAVPALPELRFAVGDTREWDQIAAKPCVWRDAARKPLCSGCWKVTA
jgi:hypothetical protein